MMSFLERVVNHRVNDGSSVEEQLSPEGLDIRTLKTKQPSHLSAKRIEFNTALRAMVVLCPLSFCCSLPPSQYPQRAKGVPAAGPTEPFQFEVRLAPVAVRQRPTPILALAAAENLDRLGEARVARRVDNLEIIESAEDVVV